MSRSLVAIVLSQALALCVAVPLIGLAVAIRERRGRQHCLRRLGCSSSTRLVLAGMVRSATIAVAAALLLGLAPLLFTVTAAGGQSRSLAAAQGVMVVLVITLAVLGYCCGTVLASVSSAAGVCYLLVAACLLAPLLAGPIIARAPEDGPLIDAALRLSPLVHVSSALDFDVMRTEWAYRASPIGQRSFRYPEPFDTWLYCGAVVVLLHGVAIAGLSLERRGLFATRRDP